jgi:hypothetical protein
LESDTVRLELLDQQAAAGQGRDMADYPEKQTFQVSRPLISPPTALTGSWPSMFQGTACFERLWKTFPKNMLSDNLVNFSILRNIQDDMGRI